MGTSQTSGHWRGGEGQQGLHTPGSAGGPQPGDGSHRRQIPAVWPGALKGFDLCCFHPVSQKTQLSPRDMPGVWEVV